MSQFIAIVCIIAILVLFGFLFLPVMHQNDEVAEKSDATEKQPQPASATTTNQKKSQNLTAVFLILITGWLLMPAMTIDAAPITVTGSIQNGTTGQPVTIQSIELLKIEQGMQLIESLPNAGPTFRFSPVEQAGATFLVRATYNHDTFISVLRPAQDPNQNIIATNITVYDSGARLDDIEFHSGLQISRLKQGLDITLVYAINNHSKPGRTFDISGLTFPVPKTATDINVSITHESSGMPVTAVPTSVDDGIQIKRLVRPGTSELSIRFKTESHVFEDRIDFTKDLLVNRDKGREFFRVLIWRPADAQPEITGGQTKVLDIPNLGKAMQVTYQNDKVTYHFNQGGIWYDNPMTSDENPIFDNQIKSTAGIVLTLLLFVLTLSFLAGSGIRISRNKGQSKS